MHAATMGVPHFEGHHGEETIGMGFLVEMWLSLPGPSSPGTLTSPRVTQSQGVAGSVSPDPQQGPNIPTPHPASGHPKLSSLGFIQSWQQQLHGVF